MGPLHGVRIVELAGLGLPQDWDGYVRSLFGLNVCGTAEILAYHDERSGYRRFAVFERECLLGAFFASPEPVAVSRAYVAGGLGVSCSLTSDRLQILAGRSAANQIDRGAIECSCFEIGLNQIVEAVTSGGCITLDAVGAALKAGTNCGSCRPEIGRVIHDHAIAKAS